MRLIALLLTITISCYCYSQKKYETFTGAGGVLEFSSQIVMDGKSKGRLYLDLNTDGLTSLKLNGESERIKLIEFLETTFTKFKGWKKTAIENNVKEKLVKDISSENLGNGLAFKRYSSGDWYFTFRPVNITARMFINEEGKVDYFIQVPEVGSSDNEYIESDRQIIIFEENDIEGLVKILKNEAIDGFMNKKSAADLFN